MKPIKTLRMLTREYSQECRSPRCNVWWFRWDTAKVISASYKVALEIDTVVESFVVPILRQDYHVE